MDSQAVFFSGRRLAIAFVVLALLTSVLIGLPKAHEEIALGVSVSGAPDILLLHPTRQAIPLAEGFQPQRVLEEVRDSAVLDSIRGVLARYEGQFDEPQREELAQMLLAEGRKSDIDPLFLAALIRVESAFAPDAISNRGARGLMQVMPGTGAELAARLGIDWEGPEQLHDPLLNVRLGVEYLAWLLQRYQGNYRFALTAYNRGPRGLRHLVRQHGVLRSEYTEYFRRVQEVYRSYLRQFDSTHGALRALG